MEKKIIPALRKKAEEESFALKLGMKVIRLEPGCAVVEMKPREDSTNIFGMIHGGAIFSLIDEAFQLSCNSHGTIAVALNVSVTYHQPPERGHILRAKSREIHCGRKTGTYEIMVHDDRDVLIASCQALAYRKKERLPFLDC